MNDRAVYEARWIFVALVLPARVVFAEPENLDLLKQQLIRSVITRDFHRQPQRKY